MKHTLLTRTTDKNAFRSQMLQPFALKKVSHDYFPNEKQFSVICLSFHLTLASALDVATLSEGKPR